MKKFVTAGQVNFVVKRKNFLPTLLIAVLFWAGLIFLIIFTAPTSPFLLTTFYLLLFLALFLTLSLVLANSRQGFLLASGIMFFLLLRLLKLASLFNSVVLLIIFASLELYLRKR